MDDPRLLRLHAADNVLTVIGAHPGAPLGHKVAACPIAPGEKVIKYGVPIGTATQPIPAGAHVHTHNLRSDYLPVCARGSGS